MARYIDAEKIKYTKFVPENDPFDGSGGLCALKSHIDAIPTADVVQVIRCKDCKYFNGKIDVLCERCGDIDEPCGGCHYTGGCTYDDGYCHHGERRKVDG